MWRKAEDFLKNARLTGGGGLEIFAAVVYQFAQYELDSRRFELRKSGKAVPVEPQVLALLLLLVEKRQRLVTKEEIHEGIWKGRIVSDAALSSRIKSARVAIGDDGVAQKLIRTVHGKGFRFVGEVREEAGAAEDAAANETRAAASTEAAIGRTAERPVVAVLPFENLSADREQEYFSDAITADIISNLSKHRWLGVVGRNSTFGYKGKSVEVRELAEALKATYVVTGCVRRSGDRFRVTVQLVDGASAGTLWSDKYDGELADVFDVQDEITARIAARLEPEIGLAERKKVIRTANPNLGAWESFHLGIAHFFKFTAEGNQRAQELFQRSRDLDPDFGEAHAWWAYAIILGMVYWDTDPDAKLLDGALAAAQSALEIDDRNAVFYALKARVRLARGEYQLAIAENEMAISMNPTLAAAHCGLADSLAYEGMYDDAMTSFRRALDLSPNDPQRWAFLTYGALALIFKRDFAAAIEWCERASLIPNCQYWTAAHRAVALAHLGRLEEAKAAAAALMVDKPGFTRAFARRKLFYIRQQDQLDLYLGGLELAGVPA